MNREIREFDNENDLKKAWKVSTALTVEDDICSPGRL